MQLSSVRELKQVIREGLQEGGHLSVLSSIGTGALEQAMEGLHASVGIGFGPTKNDFRIALRIGRDDARHHAFAAHVHLLAHGEIDFLVTRPVRAIDGCNTPNAAQVPGFQIGGSIGHKNIRGGTLGFFARRRSDGAIGIVSNNHVIADHDLGLDGDAVLHPSRCDGGTAAANVVATLDGNYPKLRGGGRKLADCAFAALTVAQPPLVGTLLGVNALKGVPAFPSQDPDIFKIGRTTGLTQGKVRSFDHDNLFVDYPVAHPFTAVFDNQIEIESATAATFSDPGDSGSVIYNSDFEPVGLLFSETASGGAANVGLQYAAPIAVVQTLLQVDLLI